MKRVLITGATGVVGQYLVEELLRETPHTLVLVVRNPGKLPDFGKDSDRVEVIASDVTDVDGYRDRLRGVDVALLVAACWGGEQTEAVNLTANLAITDHLTANGGSRVYYVSTASVLDRNHDLLQAAYELGSPYVRSKHRLVAEIEKRNGSLSVVGLFPTIVVGGGGDGRPRSHFANLLHEARPYMRIACSLSADGYLHHVHARDIATVTRLLIDDPKPDGGRGPRIVLGNPAVSVDAMIDGIRSYFGYRFLPRIRLRDGLAEFLIKTFRIELTPWDRYCMQHRDMSHANPTSPADFGVPVFAPDIGAQLAAVGLKP